MKENSKGAALGLLLSMVIFGTIGIFVKYIPMPSSFIALCRGLGGAVFLCLVMAVRRHRLSWTAIRKNLLLLTLSGAFMGVNWVLLFESYRYTTVATATLCYYMAPVAVMLLSPVVLGERLTLRGLLCGAVALVGMVFVSGVADSGLPGPGEARGILLGLGAAVLYATVVLLNKKVRNISAWDKTVSQLLVAALVMVPYVLLTENLGTLEFTPVSLVLLALVTVVHTGVAYALYFGSVGQLPGQKVAMYSYLDPVVAIILSALVLQESMTVFGTLGAVLVLGSALVSELSPRS